MAKFAGPSATSAVPATLVTHPVSTVAPDPDEAPVVTHERGAGFGRGPLSDLFLLAITNMVGEETYYETADQRDARFRDLVAKAVAEDAGWVARFVPFLRNEMQMRSASVVLACEYVRAGGPLGRSVIASACSRPDEPAEVLGYWASRYGRRFPQPVKRGVADAVARLYNERAALRYDGGDRAWRMGDVIEVVHPKPTTPEQTALFRYLLDARHHGDAAERLLSRDPSVGDAALPMLGEAAQLASVPTDQRRAVLRERGPQALADAGMSWERLSSWLPGGMDAEAWEAVIPSMGVMALVRNLRNFDQAGISSAVVDTVIAKITSAEDVTKARLFPYQTWSAYKNAPSDSWKRALGTTLDLTTANVPALDRSLILIDTSGSMNAAVSNRSKLSRVEVAAVMAMTTAHRGSNVDVVVFGHGNAKVPAVAGRSVLAGVQQVVGLVGSVGHATFGHTAMAAHFNPARHDRVFMFTDDQQHDSGSVSVDHVPVIYTVNLAGYAPSSLPSGENGRFTLGGFSDATFKVVPMLEAGRSAGWPF